MPVVARTEARALQVMSAKARASVLTALKQAFGCTLPQRYAWDTGVLVHLQYRYRGLHKGRETTFGPPVLFEHGRICGLSDPRHLSGRRSSSTFHTTYVCLVGYDSVGVEEKNCLGVQELSGSNAPAASSSSESIVPWTIVNKYYTADVHFHTRTFNEFRISNADGVPAVVYVWEHGQVCSIVNTLVPALTSVALQGSCRGHRVKTERPRPRSVAGCPTLWNSLDDCDGR